MVYAFPGAGAPDYFMGRYSESRILFRGPCRALDRPFIAVLGGTETFGKFIPQPYPALVEAATGIAMVNLGAVNAGPDLYLGDVGLRGIIARAEAVVIQVVGAQNLSNRFYQVHRRRNDRFLSASAELRGLYPEVDFTEFSFTRHMLSTLHRVSEARFSQVAAELRAVWSDRMHSLLLAAGGRAVLMWFSDHAPPQPRDAAGLDRDPLLVDAGMIAALRPLCRAYVEAVASPGARALGLSGMAYGPFDEPAARAVPGPAAHQEAAAKLCLALGHPLM